MITNFTALILEEAAKLGRGGHISANDIYQKSPDVESLDAGMLDEISEEIDRLRIYGFVSATRPRRSEAGTLIIGLTGITHEGREYLDRLRS